MTVQVEHGDCLQVMRRLISEGVQVDSVVTDAPYHLTSITERLGKSGSAPIKHGTDGAYARASRGFMGKEWDGGDVAFQAQTWALALMLLKPGGYLASFGGTRGFYRMACAIEDAGAEIRDTLCWLYGTGFPKSHNQSGKWEGWGTALKPGWEPIILAQRPSGRSVPASLARNGVGAINIDACRVHADDAQGGAYTVKRLNPGAVVDRTGRWKSDETYEGEMKPGRWPANVIHDGSDEVLEAFAAFGDDKGAQAPVTRRGSDKFRNTYGAFRGQDEAGATFRGDSGTAARFFYSAKATEGERIFTCRTCGTTTRGKPNCGHADLESHPTVKPLALMRWLTRLVTPPGGLILDPFAGTGTTGEAATAEGFRSLLIEREASYIADIRTRLTAGAT